MHLLLLFLRRAHPYFTLFIFRSFALLIMSLFISVDTKSSHWRRMQISGDFAALLSTNEFLLDAGWRYVCSCGFSITKISTSLSHYHSFYSGEKESHTNSSNNYGIALLFFRFYLCLCCYEEKTTRNLLNLPGKAPRAIKCLSYTQHKLMNIFYFLCVVVVAIE